MKRLLTFIVISNLLLNLSGCGKSVSTKKVGDSKKDSQDTTLNNPDTENLNVILDGLFDEERNQYVGASNHKSNMLIKKYVYTWSGKALYYDSVDSKYIRNLPKFLFSIDNSDVHLSNFETLVGFAPKDLENDCTKVNGMIPTFVSSDNPEKQFITFSEEQVGIELYNWGSNEPRTWCGVIELKSKGGRVLRKVWEFSVQLLYPKLDVRDARVVYEDKEREFDESNGTETTASKRRLYKKDLQGLFPKLSPKPFIKRLDNPKVIFVLELVNQHYVPFEVKLLPSIKDFVSYSLSIYDEKVVGTRNIESELPFHESTETKTYGKLRAVIPVNNMILTDVASGQNIKTQLYSDNSIYFIIPPRKEREKSSVVRIEYLSDFSTPEKFVDNVLPLNTSTIAGNPTGHLQFNFKNNLELQFRSSLGVSTLSWMKHNEEIDGTLDIVGTLN